MRLHNSIALASGVALLAACGLGAPSYPEFGEAAYVMTGAAAPSDGGPAVETTIYRDGSKMRVETLMAGRGPVSIVHDDATGAAYIVTAAPAQVSASVTPPPAAAPPATDAGVAQPQPVPPTPAAVGGSAVRIDDGDAPKPIEEAWITLGADNARRTGDCTVAGEKGAKWAPRNQTDGMARVACITDDGIVLEVMEGQRTVWRATRVARGPQDPALFGVPAGYQIIDPQAIADGVSEALQDVGQVAGDAEAPAPVAPAQPAPTPAPMRKT
ncbi:MAG: hypothetical protein NW200_14300 [Hyphomonadaceae bacterium]|nr:hypothetical protein [Hyphomonadaceae bacterium]